MFSAANQAPARQLLDLLDLLDQGATLSGYVVETRYVGTVDQFTHMRPCTSATRRYGGHMAPMRIIHLSVLPPTNTNGANWMVRLGVARRHELRAGGSWVFAARRFELRREEPLPP